MTKRQNLGEFEHLLLAAALRLGEGAYGVSLKKEIDLVNGSGIANEDAADTRGVVFISETVAALHWPGESPIGRRIRLGGHQTEPRWAEVVGIVDDVSHVGLDDEARSQMYFAHSQFRFWSSGRPVRSLTLVVKSTAPEAEVVRGLRAELQEWDPDLALSGIGTLSDARARSMARPLFASLLSAFRQSPAPWPW